MQFQDCSKLLYGENCSHSMVSAVLMGSSAFTPRVLVGHEQLPFFRKGEQDDTEGSWVCDTGLKLFESQLSCLENELSKSLSLTRLLMK